MARVVSALRLVHPFPSFLNSALVAGLALLAADNPSRAWLLAGGMLGMQFCIGVVNDLFDEQVDRVAKKWKPIAAGIVSRPLAWTVAAVAGGGGFVLAATAGPSVALMWLAMLACGLAYDARLKRTPWAWICLSVAFAILPVYAWYGPAGVLPPRPAFLIPLAALAGPLIQLSNGLPDLERDAATGLMTLAMRLGRRRSLLAMIALLLVVYGLAWVSLVGVSAATLLPVAIASALALAGLAFSASAAPRLREVGWMVQAVAVALLGIAWVATVESRVLPAL
jgi:4-hydroxybenzoate polyprenyltransferase